MYRPLPDGLTIKNSPIEGLGLFATKDIKANSFIGVTHIRDEQFENKYIRTPLGGFYNHSDKPNCEIRSTLKYFYDSTSPIRLVTTILELFTKKKIKKGQELTSKYILYEINEMTL